MKTYKLFLLFPSLMLLLTFCVKKSHSDNKAEGSLSTNYTDNINYINHYNPEGKLVKVDVEEINLFMGEESRLRKEEIYSYGESGELIEKSIYELNDQDRDMISLIKYLNGSTESIGFAGKDTLYYESSIYDDNRNVLQVKKYSYDIDSSMGYKELVESYINNNSYDGNNRLIKKREQNLLTKEEYITEYFYKTSKDTVIQIEMGKEPKPLRILKSFRGDENNKFTLHFDGDNYLLAQEEEKLNGEEITMKIYHEFKGSNFMYDTTWYKNDLETKIVSHSNMFKVITEKEYDDKGYIRKEVSFMIPGNEE